MMRFSKESKLPPTPFLSCEVDSSTEVLGLVKVRASKQVLTVRTSKRHSRGTLAACTVVCRSIHRAETIPRYTYA
ncbi:hypothetical protein M0802_006491 [Mischocyttarus mexicanus]|nr:hypothetical protein M0802_006491 [Mischocyttarus mexicanus]